LDVLPCQFIAVPSISDNKEEEGQEMINKNFERAPYQSFILVKEMISELSKMVN
jgi:hypothetical protein